MKYHHRTQKAINEYAQKYLRLYRNSHACGDSPSTARWRSHFAMCIGASGNVYYITEARHTTYNRNYWKAKKTLAATLEAALNGTATRADVIKAIDDELGSALP